VSLRVLVTGAGGYIGRAVVAALLEAGHTPVALVRRDASAAGPASAAVASGVEVRVGNLLEYGSLTAAVEGVDAICHLAGLNRVRESLEQPVRYFRVNAGGTIDLLSAAWNVDVRHVVFASTASVYGTPSRQPMSEDLPDDPRNPYAASKLAAELAVRSQGRLAATVLRLFNAAGMKDPEPTRLIPRVLAAASGRSAVVEVNGDGNAVRDYLHVLDVADAFVAALERPPPVGQPATYNIGSGIGSSVLDVVATAERVTGRHIPVVHRPAVAEAPMLVCDPNRAITDLGWKPRRSQLESILRDAWHAT
jgi:nucleoside-diphosphate-sugar epimerase